MSLKKECGICDCINDDVEDVYYQGHCIGTYDMLQDKERYVGKLFKENEKLKEEVLRLRTTLAEIQDWERIYRGGSIKHEYEIENGKGSWPI